MRGCFFEVSRKEPTPFSAVSILFPAFFLPSFFLFVLSSFYPFENLSSINLFTFNSKREAPDQISSLKKRSEGVLLVFLFAGKMQTRYMERSASMAREKRPNPGSSSEEGQPDRKRPALAR